MKKSKTLFTLADINWLIDSMKLVFPTKEEALKKLDAMNTKLDAFIGEIKTKRQVQEIHQHQHDVIDERIERVEKKLRLSPIS